MKKIYKSEVKLRKEFINDVPIDHDKEFIISFLKQIPTEKLKTLVNFQEIDFKNKRLWDDSRESKHLYEKLIRLRNENCIEFSVTLEI